MPWRRSLLLQKCAKSAIGAGSPYGLAAPIPGRRLPPKIHKNMPSPQAATVPIFRVLMRFWLPIRSGGLPICRRRFPYPVAFPICFRGSPCDSTASHTQAIFPYGIAVFPYGHTPDASPHTLRQIPIDQPFSHTAHQIPIARPSPHTIHKIQRIRSQTRRDQQVRSPQTQCHPVHANPTDLRGGGCRHLLHVRPWSRAHLHGHGHTFKGTRTAMASGHAFDETSVRL